MPDIEYTIIPSYAGIQEMPRADWVKQFTEPDPEPKEPAYKQWFREFEAKNILQSLKCEPTPLTEELILQARADLSRVRIWKPDAYFCVYCNALDPKGWYQMVCKSCDTKHRITERFTADAARITLA